MCESWQWLWEEGRVVLSGEGEDELGVRLGGGEAAGRTCESARMERGLRGPVLVRHFLDVCLYYFITRDRGG
jgi:hypothetical protein